MHSMPGRSATWLARLRATGGGVDRKGSMRPLRTILLPRGEHARLSAAARRRWRDARAFQADVRKTLARQRVSFMEWLVLETLRELCDETGGPVSQNLVADRAGLTRQVASYWMIVMSETDLVDRGPSATGHAWRVILTDLGERTLRACNERLEEAGLTG